MLKYKIGIFIFFAVVLCTFNYVSAENKTLPLLSKVIYLDPGHGGIGKIQKIKNGYKY